MKQTKMAAYLKRDDAHALEEAAKIIRRRLVCPEGMSRAAFCRTLTDEASKLRAEARELEKG